MDELIYEYACHEGNYALSNVLSGERAKRSERKKRRAAKHENRTEQGTNAMRTTLSMLIAGFGLLAATVPVAGHHAFGAEFDPNAPIRLQGKVVKLEWVNPHTWIHIEVKKPDGTQRSLDGRRRHAEHPVAAGPDQRLADQSQSGRHRLGAELIVDGYQTKDHSLKRANGRDVTFTDGRKMFMGSSGTGAPPDGRDPTDEAKETAGRELRSGRAGRAGGSGRAVVG